MIAADARSLMLALRSLLDGEGGERLARRIAAFVFEKAMSGHVGYVRFLFDAVDGPIRPTAEEEGIFESDCVIVVVNDGREVETAKAA
jgi:hypothetical protein